MRPTRRRWPAGRPAPTAAGPARPNLPHPRPPPRRPPPTPARPAAPGRTPTGRATATRAGPQGRPVLAPRPMPQAGTATRHPGLRPRAVHQTGVRPPPTPRAGVTVRQPSPSTGAGAGVPLSPRRATQRDAMTAAETVECGGTALWMANLTVDNYLIKHRFAKGSACWAWSGQGRPRTPEEEPSCVSGLGAGLARRRLRARRTGYPATGPSPRALPPRPSASLGSSASSRSTPP
ncbi:Chitinase [Micromonospora saelicesensis]|nr:Chitinase [Micromonospora saelicesensis]